MRNFKLLIGLMKTRLEYDTNELTELFIELDNAHRNEITKVRSLLHATGFESLFSHHQRQAIAINLKHWKELI